MVSLSLWPALVRWAALVALAGAIGALVLDRIVLPPADLALDPLRRKLGRWTTIGVAALLVATAGELLVRAQVMTGNPLPAALAAIPTILGRTHFGIIWLARFAALGAMFFLSWAVPRGGRGAILILAWGVALSMSLTGHAAAWGDLSASVWMDWIHLVAGATWAGGLGGLAAVVLVEGMTWSPALLATVARRFSRIAAGCLAAVASSGAYNAWLQVRGLPALWTTGYGRVLAVKILIVLGMVGMGSINRYAIIPSLLPGAARETIGTRVFRPVRFVVPGCFLAGNNRGPSQLGRWLMGEACLAIMVLTCTAVLGESTPPRHRSHAHHLSAAEMRGH